jgi:hypothetical protein
VWAPESAWTTWRRDKSCPYRDSNSDRKLMPSVVTVTVEMFLYLEYIFAMGMLLKLQSDCASVV